MSIDNDSEFGSAVDAADMLLEEGRISTALSMYDDLLASHPRSPRCRMGRAAALEMQASLRQSRSLLEHALIAYEGVLDLEETPDRLFVLAANRVVERAHQLDQMQRAIRAQRRLVDRFPHDFHAKTLLAIFHFNANKLESAKGLFAEVLREKPGDPIAQAYYGLHLVVYELNFEEGAELLMKGLASDHSVTHDYLFYRFLGDALLKLGRRDEADKYHRRGTELGLFLSPMQRPKHVITGLTARPFWTVEQTGYADALAAIGRKWRAIRDEAVSLLNSNTRLFANEDQQLSKQGDWSIFRLYNASERDEANCERAPKTCAIVGKAVDAISCTRGQIKFSVMQAGTVVFPHCGPTNCRIRAHLGLRVPEGAHIRVAGETRAWTEGEWLILDDSLEHEVWNDGDTFRLILIVDFWHPQLSAQQRSQIPP